MYLDLGLVEPLCKTEPKLLTLATHQPPLHSQLQPIQASSKMEERKGKYKLPQALASIQALFKLKFKCKSMEKQGNSSSIFSNSLPLQFLVISYDLILGISFI